MERRTWEKDQEQLMFTQHREKAAWQTPGRMGSGREPLDKQELVLELLSWSHIPFCGTVTAERLP